jgi:hypothetical protein
MADHSDHNRASIETTAEETRLQQTEGELP